MKIELMGKIIGAVHHAKKKHPVFASSLDHATSLALEELGEMAKALNDGDLKAVKAEALDTIAVLVRIIEWVEREND